LGQLTKLLSGQDRGWRGSVRVTAGLVGTPADLAIRSDGSLEDFRRYESFEGELLKLTAHCDAHYSTLDHGFHAILCQAPMGDGAIAMRGEVLKWRGPRRYDLNITAEKVPVQFIAVGHPPCQEEFAR